MHFDEHVEGIDAKYGGGGGGGKHGASVRCEVRNTVIGTAQAWFFERMDFTLLVRVRVAHLSAPVIVARRHCNPCYRADWSARPNHRVRS